MNSTFSMQRYSLILNSLVPAQGGPQALMIGIDCRYSQLGVGCIGVSGQGWLGRSRVGSGRLGPGRSPQWARGRVRWCGKQGKDCCGRRVSQ